METAAEACSAPVRYKLSGKIGNYGLLVPALSFVVAMLLGFVLGVLQPLIGSGRARIAVALAAGAGVGGAVYLLARLLKCRNTRLVQFTALGAGVLTLYVAAAVLCNRALTAVGGLPPSFGALLLNPAELWTSLDLVSVSGVIVDVRGRPYSSGGLWMNWVITAACVVVGPVCAAWRIVQSIFCENCECWLEYKRMTMRFEVPDEFSLIDRLMIGDLAALLELTPGKPLKVMQKFVKLDYVMCGTCGDMGTYQIVTINRKNKKGIESALSHPMVLTAENVRVLGLLLEKERQQPKPKIPVAPLKRSPLGKKRNP